MTLSVFASPVQPNEGCLESLCHESNGQKFFDCLLLPGDLCTSEDLFEEVMGTLTAAFQKVFFCFGNHEAWTRGEKKGTSPAKDSFQKLERIHQICKTLGVYTLLCGSSQDQKNLWENHEPEHMMFSFCNFYPWYHDISCFFFWWVSNLIDLRVRFQRWKEMIPSSLCCFHCGHGIIPAGKPGRWSFSTRFHPIALTIKHVFLTCEQNIVHIRSMSLLILSFLFNFWSWCTKPIRVVVVVVVLFTYILNLPET